MAELRVNPTRMELKKLQGRYNAARRGHKLLKDKCDGLTKQFLELRREAVAARAKADKALARVQASFAQAGAESSPELLRTALLMPRRESEVHVELRNRMGVVVPEFTLRLRGEGGCGYGFAFTPAGLDAAVTELGDALELLLRMAELEKEVQMLEEEVERTRRRVNALEHIMMPRYLAAMKTVKMKLEENERGSITRLMKVKDMMLAATAGKRYSFIPDEAEEEE